MALHRGIRKDLLIFIYILSLTLIAIIYFPNRNEIKSEISYFIPQLYSPKNKDMITVSQIHSQYLESITKDIEPIPNSEFVYNPDLFDIDNTDKLDLDNLSCKPESFGYSSERGNEVFPEKKYPKCSLVSGQNSTYMHIDRKSNKVYMNCPGGKNDQILTGPFDNRKLINREIGYENWHPQDYKGPIPATGVEFALGSCEQDDGKFMQGNILPIFNESAYENAKKKVVGKPKLIFFLTLDSFSRKHFFRKLPNVVDFLNQLNSEPDSKFSVFDFMLQNAQGGDSPDNQVPIMLGDPQFPKTTPGDQNRDFLGDKAIWSLLRKKGYVSFAGFESCDDNFVKSIGRMPNVDYVVQPFYCAVEKFSSIKFGKGFNHQRCIGGHMSHYYILNYTKTLIEWNKGVNLMMYLHINAGHEGSGQHAATLNEDIKEYLENLLKNYEEFYDILIFFNGDHGMRYGNWYKEIYAYQEQKLPMLYIIASKSLLNQFDNSYHCLSENTKRLVSKVDYRKTALFIAGIEDKSIYSINLIGEIAPRSRTCDDLGISPWDCACLKMLEVTELDDERENLISILKDYAENTINSLSYSEVHNALGTVCKKIELGQIDKIYHISINNVEEMYKLEVKSPTRENMKFSVTFFLASDGEQMGANIGKFRLENTVFRGNPIKIRVWFM